MIPARFELMSRAAALFRLGRRLSVLFIVLGLVMMVRIAGPIVIPRAEFDGPVPVQQVVVIGIDGLTARALGQGHTPTLDQLLRQGSGTLKARAVAPTMSSPNWASHLMGAGPKEHAIGANDWRPKHWRGESFCQRNTGEGWPTIFEVIHTQNQRARLAVFYDWIGIQRFVPRRFVNRLHWGIWETRVMRLGLRQYRRWGPTLTFVHLDHVDEAGHAFGFDSPEYLQQVERADKMVAQFREEIAASGFAETTLLMIISDHGGRGKGHGGLSRKEFEIPYILWGAGVQPGTELTGVVTVRDTSPTIAWALGIPQPSCWTGRALIEAFKT